MFSFEIKKHENPIIFWNYLSTAVSRYFQIGLVCFLLLPKLKVQKLFVHQPRLRRSQDQLLRPKIERYFLESFFLERNSWSSITARTTLFPSMSVEWIHFPRIRTFVQKRFHGLFSKKKRSQSGVFLRFQKENTFGQ